MRCPQAQMAPYDKAKTCLAEAGFWPAASGGGSDPLEPAM